MAKPDTMNFSKALEDLVAGKHIQRLGWNGKDQFCALESGDEQSGELPYISFTTENGDTVPWVASQTDLLAKDWIVLEK